MKLWEAIVGVVSAVLLGFVFLLLLFKIVLPQLVAQFAGLGIEIPLPVSVVLTISYVVRQWIFIGSVLFLVLVYSVFKYQESRKETH